jgi:hypothetical protein
MLNPYSEEERLQAMVSACFRASRSHFNHLSIKHIIDPPRDIYGAVCTIDDRMYDPIFERAYARISARAQDLFMTSMREASMQEDAA